MRFPRAGLIPLLLLAAACDEPQKPAPSPAPTASASALARPPKQHSFPVANGPKLVILPGRGISPIRIGATVATVERLMQRPCDERTPKVCRYVSRGVELELDEGVVRAIHVHRMGRSTGTKSADGAVPEYGAFNGGFAPNALLGMLPWAIQEVVGKPQRVEKLQDGGPHGTVELHHYPGMVLEYDRNPKNDKLILGGARIFPADAG